MQQHVYKPCVLFSLDNLGSEFPRVYKYRGHGKEKKRKNRACCPLLLQEISTFSLSGWIYFKKIYFSPDPDLLGREVKPRWPCCGYSFWFRRRKVWVGGARFVFTRVPGSRFKRECLWMASRCPVTLPSQYKADSLFFRVATITMMVVTHTDCEALCLRKLPPNLEGKSFLRYPLNSL